MDELNRSCDRCGLKKRKCSGEKPCARCVKSRAVCHYSKRRPRTPSRQLLAAIRAQGSSSPSLLQGPAKPTLKRPKLSASPATGLVGMQENTFLCDFFGSMGFMPLTTQCNIRKTMMKIILPFALQRSAVGHDRGEEKKLDTIIPGGEVADALGSADPSACTFWCAVAMGALAKGTPVDSVATYARLASDALASSSGPVSTETAQAWTNLGYMHGLMGDQEKFHEYLALADGFLSDCDEKGTSDMLPVGFAETIRMGGTFKVFLQDAGPEEMEESFFAEDLPRPQLGPYATEGELCQHIFQPARAFGQAVLAGIMCTGRRSAGFEDVGEMETDATDAGPAMETATTADRSGGTSPLHCPRRPVELLPLSPAALEHLLTVFEFRRMEEALESPSVGSGMGGLIINNRLLYGSTARGDARGALDRVERCIEILERYPGLHRFRLGAHKTHKMIVILVAIATARARELYHRIRAVFNLARPPGFMEVPPWDEWRGVSTLCDYKACRSVEATLAGEEKPSTCASPFLKLAADEEQLGDVHGTNIRQAGECLHVHSEPARLDCREPFSVVRGLSEAWRTVPTMATHEPPSHVRTMACPISDDRENVCGTDDAAISGGREPCPDLFAEGAGVSLRPLDPRRTSSNETEDGGVVAEDWLDAVHAIDSSESDSAVG